MVSTQSLCINIKKNKADGINTDISTEFVSKSLRQSAALNTLDQMSPNEGSKPGVLSRITQTTAAMLKLRPSWNDRNIRHSPKIRLTLSLGISIVLYACGTGTLTIELERRIQTTEIK